MGERGREGEKERVRGGKGERGRGGVRQRGRGGGREGGRGDKEAQLPHRTPQQYKRQCTRVILTEAHLVSVVQLSEFLHFVFLESCGHFAHSVSENVDDLMQHLEHGLWYDL